MKMLAIALIALLASSAYAQTPPTPPVVTLPMPAPAGHAVAGENITLSWAAVTANVNGSALLGPVTYDLWNVTSGTAVLVASGLTVALSERLNLAVGTPCYVVTGLVAGEIDSVGSTPPYCVSVTAAPEQVGQPGPVTGAVTP